MKTSISSPEPARIYGQLTKRNAAFGNEIEKTYQVPKVHTLMTQKYDAEKGCAIQLKGITLILLGLMRLHILK